MPFRLSGSPSAGAGLACLAALAVAGCSGPLSTLEPLGPVASSLAWLWWAMLAGSTVLLVLMTALFAVAIWRPHWGRGLSARSWMIWGGLVLPGVVLPPLVVVSLVAGERLLPDDPVPRIEAEAAQWFWTFRYPDHGGATTIDILHLPVNQPIDIVITSRDVIHAFWVPRLAGKLDAIPGRENVLRVEAGVPGPMEGLCAEFCGRDHTHMRFDIMVHDSADFGNALASDSPSDSASVSDSAGQEAP